MANRKLTQHQAEMLHELLISRTGRVIIQTMHNQALRTARSLRRKGLCTIKLISKMEGAQFSYGYRAVELSRCAGTPGGKMIEIHTVEVVARDVDDQVLKTWTIVSAEPEADIVKRFERELRGEYCPGGPIYRYTAHRMPGTATMIEEDR